ncbi:MAG: hypothetical protein IPG43_09400 [Proteobacteria bacterium]|nr:hypothetical protein [Pseudomonadota bacterium]
MSHVADKFDLRKDIQFNTRIAHARWDDATRRWSLETGAGEALYRALLRELLRRTVGAGGAAFPGPRKFKGAPLHTPRWPRQGSI